MKEIKKMKGIGAEHSENDPACSSDTLFGSL